MLFWYPYRYSEKRYPFWVPDFQRRAVPAESEKLPPDYRESDPKLTIVNHAICAQGYRMSSIWRKVSFGTDDFAVFRCLWIFDQTFSDNIPNEEYATEFRLSDLKRVINKVDAQILLEGATTDESLISLGLSFRAFFQTCRNFQTYDHNKSGWHSILKWSSDFKPEENIPLTVVDAYPNLEILMWHLFGYGRPEIARLLRSTDSGLYNKNSCPPWKLYFADS